MRGSILLPLLVVTLLVETVDSARILGIFPLFAKSHHDIIHPILKALTKAGHELVLYSPFPIENPPTNYTYVNLEKINTKGKSIDDFFNVLIEMPHWKCLDNMLPLHDDMLHGVFQSAEIKKLLSSNEKFDVIFTETFLAQEFTLIFGHIFKAPTIGIQTFFTTNLLNLHLGNALSFASIPDACFPFSNKMSFFERFLNLFCHLRGIYMYYNEYIPLLERKLRTYFPDAPPILELTKNVSLMFINDHMAADYPQPRPPTMIPVAGIHIKPEKTLPKDIKTFMDEAPHGVILFSMGSLVPDDTKPKEYFDTYVTVFKKLRQRVLWKTRKDKVDGLSDNVMLVKWMPQRDVLAHPNCVLFITHGGLASQHETIYNGVPVVAVPHFADQHRNVGFYHAQEIGVRVLLSELNSQTMLAAINKVLDDPKYRENMQRLSRIFKDRPMSPEQSVVFWTEYVLRHDGAPHLKPASTQLKLYQLALLDVIATVVAVVTCFIIAICFIVKKLTYFRRKTLVSPSKKTN